MLDESVGIAVGSPMPSDSELEQDPFEEGSDVSSMLAQSNENEGAVVGSGEKLVRAFDFSTDSPLVSSGGMQSSNADDEVDDSYDEEGGDESDATSLLGSSRDAGYQPVNGVGEEDEESGAGAVESDEESDEDDAAADEPQFMEPAAELPAKEDQLEAMKALDDKLELKEGEYWYLVQAKWWREWMGYSGYEEPGSSYYVMHRRQQDEPPDTIDNSMLLNDKGELLRPLHERSDYFLLHSLQWNLVRGWYGGGPPIRRRVISAGSKYQKHLMVEVQLILIYVVKSSDMQKQHPMYVSKDMKCSRLLKKTCKVLEVNPKEVQMWDYHGNSKLKHLNEPDTRLQEHQIINNQKILIQEKDEDGKFPSTSRTTYGNYGYSYNSGGAGSSYGYGYSSYGEGTREPTTPGLCGLRNLGNTCFMAGAIQCLSNNLPLRKFFTSTKYKTDINTDNPLGAGGQLAEKFAELMEKMWSGEYSVQAPRDLKSKIERLAPQFSGWSQHDSQEFLLYLLDGLHEDLNRRKEKPLVPHLESDGRPDEVVAKEAWEGHLLRNDSKVMELFQAQLKSTLVCPQCDRVSITFDPYSTLSLPLPVATTRRMKVTVWYQDVTKKPVTVRVVVPKSGKVQDLCAAVQELLEISRPVMLAEEFGHRFYREYMPEESLKNIKDADHMYLYEYTPEPDALPAEEGDDAEAASGGGSAAGAGRYGDDEDDGYNYVTGTTRGYYTRPTPAADEDGAFVHVRLLSQKKTEMRSYSYSSYHNYNHVRKELFGYPQLISVPRDISYKRLYLAILERYEYMFAANDYLEKHMKLVRKLIAEEEGEELVVETVPSAEGASAASSAAGAGEGEEVVEETVEVYEETTEDTQLFTMSVTNASGQQELDSIREDGGAALPSRRPVYIAVLWEDDVLDDVRHPTSMVEHESCQVVEEDSGNAVDLYQCLTAFSKPEKLSPQDSWYCSNCKEHQEATKQVELYALPPNLTIHLKRFSYSLRDKLDMKVVFPVSGLDLSEFVVSPACKGMVYDLYAVDNHFGSMGGGHYTAFGKNSKTGKWYKFDDSAVREVNPESVITEAAYVLFYRRRGAWAEEEEEEAVSDAAAGASDDDDSKGKDAAGDLSDDGEDTVPGQSISNLDNDLD